MLTPKDKSDLGPTLFLEGVAMLIIAPVAVVVGVLADDGKWFAFALLIGFIGLIYVVVVGALR